jgi:hypothetical protein
MQQTARQGFQSAALVAFMLIVAAASWTALAMLVALWLD